MREPVHILAPWTFVTLLFLAAGPETYAVSAVTTAEPGEAQVAAAANPMTHPATPVQRTAAEVETLAARIALYPDPLIGIILPASVYPLEVVLAAKFVSDTNRLSKLDEESWDENVKAVARLPAVIQMMSAELPWTVAIGQVFLHQPQELMESIQALRARAQAAGTLKSTPEQVVVVTNAVVERSYQQQVVYVTNTVVQVQPARPEVIYVPQYNPTAVFSTNSTATTSEPAASLLAFGAAIAVGAVIANNCDWNYGGVYVGHGGVVIVGGGGDHPPYHPPPPGYRPPPYHPPPGYHPPPPGYRPPGYPPPRPPGAAQAGATSAGSGRWQPDPTRLNNTGAAGATTREARGWGSGNGSGFGEGRISNGDFGARPSADGLGSRPSAGTDRASVTGDRPALSANAGSSFERDGRGSNQSAFGDMGTGSSTREFSNRGASSRTGGSGFSGFSEGSGGGRRGGRGGGRR